MPNPNIESRGEDVQSRTSESLNFKLKTQTLFRPQVVSAPVPHPGAAALARHIQHSNITQHHI